MGGANAFGSYMYMYICSYIAIANTVLTGGLLGVPSSGAV